MFWGIFRTNLSTNRSTNTVCQWNVDLRKSCWSEWDTGLCRLTFRPIKHVNSAFPQRESRPSEEHMNECKTQDSLHDAITQSNTSTVGHGNRKEWWGWVSRSKHSSYSRSIIHHHHQEAMATGVTALPCFFVCRPIRRQMWFLASLFQFLLVHNHNPSFPSSSFFKSLNTGGVWMPNLIVSDRYPHQNVMIPILPLHKIWPGVF